MVSVNDVVLIGVNEFSVSAVIVMTHWPARDLSLLYILIVRLIRSYVVAASMYSQPETVYVRGQSNGCSVANSGQVNS